LSSFFCFFRTAKLAGRKRNCKLPSPGKNIDREINGKIIRTLLLDNLNDRNRGGADAGREERRSLRKNEPGKGGRFVLAGLLFSRPFLPFWNDETTNPVRREIAT
jgi:hypothetical protein